MNYKEIVEGQMQIIEEGVKKAFVKPQETEAEKMERYNREYWRQRGTGSELQETGFPHERDSSWYPY